MQTEPAADTPAAETVETHVPAVEMPTDTYEVIEAEQVSLSESEIRVIKGGTTTLTAELPEAERGESPLTTFGAVDHYDNAVNGWTLAQLNACDGDDTQNLFSQYCIYGNDKETDDDVTNGLIVCTGCRKVATGEITLP